MNFKRCMERLFNSSIGFYKFWERFFVNTQKAILKAGRNPGGEDLLGDYEEFLEKQKIRKQKEKEQIFFPRNRQWVHLTNGIGLYGFCMCQLLGALQ